MTANFKANWYRQKYYIDKGYLKPAPEAVVGEYNPFDFYRTGNRIKDNLHHLFAGVDLSDEKEIVAFYSKYGPLGLYNRDILKIVAFPPYQSHLYPMPEKSPVAGVQRFTGELIPLPEIVAKYNIPMGKLPVPPKGDLVISEARPTILDTWESVKDFKYECERFKWVMELQSFIPGKDLPSIRRLFEESSNEAFWKVAKEKDETKILLTATGFVLWTINQELVYRAYPYLTFDESSTGISKDIFWQCESLLTAMYAMLLKDITRGVLSRKCEKCSQFFEAKNPDIKFCSISCQTSAKTKRFREKHGIN